MFAYMYKKVKSMCLKDINIWIETC